MKSKPVYVLLAAAMLALIVMPIAFAGAAGSPQSKVNASLKKQLRQVKQRLATLEGKQAPTTLPPSGPAGGDLTGTYPNPQIRPATVGTPELADAAVTNQKLADNSVTSDEIAENAVGPAEIGFDSVGAFALKGVVTAVSNGVNIANGSSGATTVTCPTGTMLIAGGYAWSEKEANSIIASAPSEGDPNRTWIAEGIASGGSSNSLFAWATCIQA